MFFFFFHPERQDYSFKSVITTSHFQEYGKEIMYGGEGTSLKGRKPRGGGLNRHRHLCGSGQPYYYKETMG